MDRPGAMRFVEGVCDLNGIPERQVERQGASRQAIRQRLSFEILHDQEGGAAFVANVV